MLPLSTWRKAIDPEAVRVAEFIDEPSTQVSDDRCDPCDYRDTCVTKTRSIRSPLRR